MKTQIVISILKTILFLSMWLWPSNLQAQQNNGVVFPEPNEIVSGVVIVQGTADDPDFLRYELAFLSESVSGSDWIVFAQGDKPVINGSLAVWDTLVGSETNRIFPDGRYRLRLRVVRNDYNYEEYYVTDIFIANGSQTPTPIASETAELGSDLATLIPEERGTVQSGPSILASLTPFPTPTMPATPINVTSGPGISDLAEQESQPGLLEQLTSIDSDRYSRAFWRGVTVVFGIFIILALYLIFRGLMRRIWRQIQSKLIR